MSACNREKNKVFNMYFKHHTQLELVSLIGLKQVTEINSLQSEKYSYCYAETR